MCIVAGGAIISQHVSAVPAGAKKAHRPRRRGSAASEQGPPKKKTLRSALNLCQELSFVQVYYGQ
eukprot:1751220-Amphidinium_carterae.1